MRAQVLQAYATPFILREDFPMPSFDPDSDPVLVRIKSASFNPTENAFKSGSVQAFLSLTFPLILGKEESGIVERIGSKVRSLEIGDQVVAVFGK